MTPTRLQPGELWAAVRARSVAARADGALHRVATRPVIIDDGGMAFVVHVAENLRRKQAIGRPSGAGAAASPFLPPEAALTVGLVSDTHVAVLNKFNVVEAHLLIVTRSFREQETLLDRADFEAFAIGLREGSALGFYNGGRAAGASQAHKHLQLIPLPLAGSQRTLPIDTLLEPVSEGATLPLPFRHRFVRLPSGLWERPPAAVARVLEAHYRAQLADLAIPILERAGTAWQGAPYNLLLTRDWMMSVPRRRESIDGISLNALAFAGSLFVRDEAELEGVRRSGPMRLLEAAA